MTKAQLDKITQEVVAEYLVDNPDFFIKQPDLLDRLVLPHQTFGAVSLLQVQLKRQRQRIEELEEEITTLMSLAASNDRTFHAFMDLHETLFACVDLQQVFAAVQKKATELGLRAYMRFADTPFDEMRLDQEHWANFCHNHFNGKQAYLGRMRKNDRDVLFGAGVSAPEFGSYVILPLPKQMKNGFVAFSSDDGGHFQPCMDTLFLRHLTTILAYLVETLPWQRARHDGTA